MTTRYIEVNNEKLKDLVIKKGEVVDKGRKHYQEMEKLNEIGIAIGEERNAIVSDIVKITKDVLKKEELSEFEMATTTDIKDGVLRIEIIDRLAQAKATMRKEKDLAERKETGELTEEEIIEDSKKKIVQAIQHIPKEDLLKKLKAILKVID